MAVASASLTLQNLARHYGKVRAVDDLSVQVPDGAFVTLLGPSGCGKSTTLSMIAGLDRLDGGRILLGDQDITGTPPNERRMAMVFQNYALYPHMSVFDNLAFGLKLRKTPKKEIDRRVHEAAEILGIAQLLDRKPRQLSGGQRQRVAVGRAIVRDPAVFLFDEPLSNLDAKLRVQTRAEISKLHQRLGTTFIYVTHDQVEAMTMATRIAVMKDGLLMQIDSPQNLYDHPGNVFVAGFIGSPSMNFFDATLTGTDGEIYVDTGAFRVKIPAERMEPYKPYKGKQVIFGLRPENMHDPEYAPPGIHQAVVESKVEVTELMGNEVMVYLNAKDKSFVARVDPRSKMRVGNTVGIAFDMDRFHIFDKQTEKAIR